VTRLWGWLFCTWCFITNFGKRFYSTPGALRPALGPTHAPRQSVWDNLSPWVQQSVGESMESCFYPTPNIVPLNWFTIKLHLPIHVTSMEAHMDVTHQSSHFIDNRLTDGVEAVRLVWWPPTTHWKIWVLISVRGWVDPRAMVQLVGLGKLNLTSISSELILQSINIWVIYYRKIPNFYFIIIKQIDLLN
jgi:hypothetical protein